MEILEKYKPWKILYFFLLHPDSKFNINQIARELHIAPMTAFISCKEFHAERIFNVEKRKTEHLYSLNQIDPRIGSLKKAVGTFLVMKKNILQLFKKNRFISVYLYGSYADGSYDEKSDVDIFILTTSKKNERDKMHFYNLLKEQIEVKTQVTWCDIVSLKKLDKIFLNEVKKGIRIYGENL